MIDGQVVATGSSIGLGSPETLTMTFTDANQYSDTATTNLTAGEYYGIGIDAGGIPQQLLLAEKTKLDTTQANIAAQNFTGMTKDDVIGNLLYATAISYYGEYDLMDRLEENEMGVIIARVPSEAVFSVTMNVSYMFGVAENVSPTGLKMDVQRNLEMTEALNGDNNKVIQYNIQSGINGSILESQVPEQLFSTPTNHIEGVSALKALQIANDEGIPIYTLNQSNIVTILPQLQLSSDVINDIQNAVNAGDIVTVSKTEITSNGWNGVGYVIIDPTTGSGAYMISGGLGGWIIALKTIALFLLIVLVSIAIVAAGPEIAAFLTVFTEVVGELPAALMTVLPNLENHTCLQEQFIIHG